MEISNELRKLLNNAIKQTKKNNDSYLGTDALLKALLENKDVASALSEAGKLQRRTPKKNHTDSLG